MEDGNATKADGQPPGMTLTRKLMLCAQLFGLEAVINFEQIYTVPALQTLGMPLSLVYVPGLVAGPTSLLILPLLGWFIDRGHNPHCRKIAAIVFAAGLQVGGLLSVLVANVLHLQYLLDFNSTALADTGSGRSLNESVSTASGVDWAGGGVVGENRSSLGPDSSPGAITDSGDISLAVSSEVQYDTGSVPFKAGLGMLGFILMDLGFDACNCFVKAFLVSSSAREEQTSVIVLGVVVGAGGGVFNAALGLVDFTSLLGLGDIDGAKLTIQTSVQGVVLIAVVILGLVTTSLIGYKQLQLQNKSRTTSSDLLENSRTSRTKVHKSRNDSRKVCENGVTSNRKKFTPRVRKSSMTDAFESSIRSIGGGGGLYLESSMSLLEENPPDFDEDVPLLESGSLREEVDGDHLTSHPVVYGTSGEASTVEMPDRGSEGFGRSEEHGSRRYLSCLQNSKVRIGIVFVTTFFSADAVVMYTSSVSDFVGKAVYGGDPTALPGSDSLNRYQDGMTAASWSLLVYFITYLVCSLVHPRVLAVLGFRVEFPLVQMLMVISLAIAAGTARLEAVFVLSVMAATLRTCFYTMPYAVTNDIAQTIVIKESGGRKPVGLALSVVTASIPLSYCVLYTWVGAVEQLTGDVSVPLWLGSAAGFLAVVAFLFVGKV